MASNPCTACSWTPERQNGCRYKSHVKLFYSVSDRAAWSLGTNLILKERSNDPPNFEALNIQFLRRNTLIPLPVVVEDWSEENGRYFILTKRVRGDPLSDLWSTMPPEDRDRVARQTAEYLLQLRNLHSPRMQSLDGKPLYSAFLFRNGDGVPHGPLDTDEDLWTELETALKHRNVPERARERLRSRMPSAKPYTFTHGDLTSVNIMVEDGNLTGIIDWEASGYFPVWWEYTCAGIGLGQEDFEWKTLLRKYMPDYSAAREFWLDLFALSRYPDLNERGLALVDGCDS